MTPQTVDGCYSAWRNEIVLPAGKDRVPCEGVRKPRECFGCKEALVNHDPFYNAFMWVLTIIFSCQPKIDSPSVELFFLDECAKCTRAGMKTGLGLNPFYYEGGWGRQNGTMKRNISAAFVAIFVLFFYSTAFTQSKASKIDSILTTLESRDGFSGNVLVAVKGRTILAKSYGTSNVDTGAPLRADSHLLIGSVSKTLTATAIFTRREKNKLSLDDSLAKFIPELQFPKVTIHHLLAHTSGIPEYQSEKIIQKIAGKGVSNRELIRTIAELKVEADFPPGSKWAYSNTNYIVLALIIEIASGKTYQKYLQEEIFKRAGMTSTFITKDSVPQHRQNDIVFGHRLVHPWLEIL